MVKYHCECGRQWTSRNGGLKICNHCGEDTLPGQNTNIGGSVHYDCDCGNAWTSRTARGDCPKTCDECGAIVYPSNSAFSNTNTAHEWQQQEYNHFMYNCYCGKSWNSRHGGMKACHSCGVLTMPNGQDDTFSESSEEFPTFDFFNLFHKEREKQRLAEEAEERGRERREKERKMKQQKDRSEKEKAQSQKKKAEEKLKKEADRVASEKQKAEEKRRLEAEKMNLEKKKLEEKKRREAERAELERKQSAERKKMEAERKRLQEAIEKKKAEIRKVQAEQRRHKSTEDAARKEENGQKSSAEKNGWEVPDEYMGSPRRKENHQDTSSGDCQNTDYLDFEKSKRRAEQHKELGNQHFKEGRFEKAIELYSAAIDLVPRNASYYSNRGLAFMKLEMFKDALNDSKKATDLDPSSTKAYSRQIKCMLALGEGLLAERACGELLKLSHSDAEATSDLETAVEIQCLKMSAKFNSEAESFNLALDDVEKILVKSPYCDEIKFKRAELLVNIYKYDDADRYLDDLERQFPGNPEVEFVRGLFYYNKDLLNAAKVVFKQVLTKIPDHARAASKYKKTKKLQETKLTADGFVKQKKYLEALDKYDEALVVDPDNHMTNAKIYSNRALTNLELDHVDCSIKDCTEAIRLDPRYTKVYIRRARCYRRTGCLEEAMNDMEIASELNKSPDILKELQEMTKEFEECERKKSKDYHEILGVSKTASQAEIKKTFMKLARVHHPDRHSASTPLKRRHEERRFKSISEAYNALTNSAKTK